ncbi:MAG: histidine phosphatase family protein [Planctomycetota bacterium]|nr:histidine phosphatase family protein [Planctomycetota bacterium]
MEKQTKDKESRFLILMRHAKSDWGDSSLSDHERPLNARGRRDSPRMAGWLADSGWTPDLVLSSSSTRTRETYRRMVERWNDEPVVSFTDALYLASPESILQSIRTDGLESERLMVITHNPGISYLASVLAGQAIEMPTAAVAVFQLDLSDWHELRESTPIQLVQTMRPKALDRSEFED